MANSGQLRWVFVLPIPIALLGLLLSGHLSDPSVSLPVFHFYVVSLATSLSLFLALFILLAARKAQDARVLFLGLTFYTMAGLFLIHALTTPGALISNDNIWVGLSARLALLVGAAFLGLSTVEWQSRRSETILGHWTAIVVGTSTAMLLFGYIAMSGSSTPGSGYGSAGSYSSGEYGSGSYSAAPASPTSVETGPGTASLASFDVDDLLGSSEVAVAVTGLTLLLLTAVAVRQGLLYRHTRRPVHGGFFAATTLIAQAQISMYIAPVWHVSWWEYHGLIIGAFGVAIGGVIAEFSRGGGLTGVVEGLLLREAVAEVQRGYTEVVSALVEAIEAKDPYTRGHTQRVSELAVLVGEEMGLSPDELDMLYRSAMLHDIGKIGIPDSILNKPGRLTAPEFEVVKQHPVRGHLIIRNVRSLQSEIAGVRHHHERMDGSGYPDGLQGDEIPLMARIIAVADVFDAITSARPYREGWTVDEALAQIDREAGAKLDVDCVAALHRAYVRIPKNKVESIRVLPRAA